MWCAFKEAQYKSFMILKFGVCNVDGFTLVDVYLAVIDLHQ
jgi:hypothetical protein